MSVAVGREVMPWIHCALASSFSATDFWWKALAASRSPSASAFPAFDVLLLGLLPKIDAEVVEHVPIVGRDRQGMPQMDFHAGPELQLVLRPTDARRRARTPWRNRCELEDLADLRQQADQIGDAPGQHDEQADVGDVGVAVGVGLLADLDDADHRHQGADVPEPAHRQVAPPIDAAQITRPVISTEPDGRDGRIVRG